MIIIKHSLPSRLLASITTWGWNFHKRKQKSKKTRKQELDQESDQEKKKVFLFFLIAFLFSFINSHLKKIFQRLVLKIVFCFFLGRLIGRERVFFSFFFTAIVFSFFFLEGYRVFFRFFSYINSHLRWLLKRLEKSNNFQKNPYKNRLMAK